MNYYFASQPQQRDQQSSEAPANVRRSTSSGHRQAADTPTEWTPNSGTSGAILLHAEYDALKTQVVDLSARNTALVKKCEALVAEVRVLTRTSQEAEAKLAQTEELAATLQTAVDDLTRQRIVWEADRQTLESKIFKKEILGARERLHTALSDNGAGGSTVSQIEAAFDSLVAVYDVRINRLEQRWTPSPSTNPPADDAPSSSLADPSSSSTGSANRSTS